MGQVTVLAGEARGPLVLTCEHASCVVPLEYDDLGLLPAQIEDHIGWDIGAAWVTQRLSSRLASTAILSAVSRLVIDCNRELSDHDLIVAKSDGIVVPGNLALSEHERQRRIDDFFEPFHGAIDRVLASQRPTWLLSVHSFTPALRRGPERPFDIGVLFDIHDGPANALREGLRGEGFDVRLNEPYSGLDGLIYSAKRHGMKHRLCYLELEINNRLLRTESSAVAVADRLVGALEQAFTASPL